MIDAYNVYEVELEDKKIKIDCSYEDVSILSISINNEIIDSFDIAPCFLCSVTKAISYVLKLNNKDIKVTRNISEEADWRYSVMFYNNILTLHYIEDGHEECCHTMEVKIENNDIEKLVKFFNTVSNLEKLNEKGE